MLCGRAGGSRRRPRPRYGGRNRPRLWQRLRPLPGQAAGRFRGRSCTAPRRGPGRRQGEPGGGRALRARRGEPLLRGTRRGSRSAAGAGRFPSQPPRAARHLTFFNLKMCLLPLPFVETFFSAAGADLYLVFLSRAERRWISCLL